MKWPDVVLIYRSAEDIACYNADCVPVTHDTVGNAVKWLWDLDRLAPVSKTATCEAVLRAVADTNVGLFIISS